MNGPDHNLLMEMEAEPLSKVDIGFHASQAIYHGKEGQTTSQENRARELFRLERFKCNELDKVKPKKEGK